MKKRHKGSRREGKWSKNRSQRGYICFGNIYGKKTSKITARRGKESPQEKL